MKIFIEQHEKSKLLLLKSKMQSALVSSGDCMHFIPFKCTLDLEFCWHFHTSYTYNMEVEFKGERLRINKFYCALCRWMFGALFTELFFFFFLFRKSLEKSLIPVCWRVRNWMTPLILMAYKLKTLFSFQMVISAQ